MDWKTLQQLTHVAYMALSFPQKKFRIVCPNEESAKTIFNYIKKHYSMINNVDVANIDE